MAKKAEITTDLFLASVLQELAATAAQSAAYQTWTDEFSRKEVLEVWLNEPAPLRRKRDRKVTITQLLELPKETLRLLGFLSWNADLTVIPLWAFNYIADGERLVSIDGTEAAKGHDKIDLDVRFGCIAWGFRPINQPIATREEEDGEDQREGERGMSSTSDEVGHTATPWNAREYVAPVGNWYVKGFGGETVISGLGLKRGDALIIERAVNSHDSLVKALEVLSAPKIREPKRSDYGSDDAYWEACGAWRMILKARALSQAKGGK